MVVWFLSSSVQCDYVAHPAPCQWIHGTLSPMWPQHEGDHWPQSRVMTKNVLSITYNLLYAFKVYYPYKHMWPLQVSLFRTLIQNIISVTGTLCILHQKCFQNKTLGECMPVFLTLIFRCLVTDNGTSSLQ